MLSRSTSPRSHASALATPFAGGSPAAPGPAAALPTSRDAGGAPAHRAGGEVDARAGGAAPAQDGGRAEAGRGAATAAAPLPPRHGHTLSGGSSGGSAALPWLPPAGPAGPAADGGGGGGGGSGAAGGPAAARRSSNALSDLGAEVQSPSSASRCAPWSAPRAALRGGGAGGRRPMQGAGAAGRARRPAAESLEAQLSHKLAEYAENRSLTSVVPVCDPLTTDEPELLEMSPEQAEETQLCAPRLRQARAAWPCSGVRWRRCPPHRRPAVPDARRRAAAQEAVGAGAGAAGRHAAPAALRGRPRVLLLHLRVPWPCHPGAAARMGPQLGRTEPWRMAKPCDNTPETPEGTPPRVMRQARPREYLCGFADLAQQLQPGHCAPPRQGWRRSHCAQGARLARPALPRLERRTAREHESGSRPLQGPAAAPGPCLAWRRQGAQCLWAA